MSEHRNARSGLVGALVLGGFGLVGTLPAGLSAQGTDARWLPFVGCWEAAGTAADEAMVCFRPITDDPGVEMLTVSEGEISAREILRADGTPREFSLEGCTGQERSEFSEDGRRVYTDARYVCEGGVSRTTSGIMSLAAPTQWMDVKSVDVEGEKVAWVQFYELASRQRVREAELDDIGADRVMAIDAARMAASAPVGLDDVEEAVERADAEAVEAWVAELGQPFDLDADKLLRLADADVPESVIDVVVAVSYPRTFVLDDAGRAEPAARDVDPDRRAYGLFPYGRYYDPYYMDPFYRRYGVGYGYGYGYGGGYSLYSPYGYYGYSPRVVVVGRRDGGQGARAVRGRGYTRGSSSSAGTGRVPTGRSVVGSGGSSPKGSVSAGSGSKGSSGARKAKRRGGG